MGDILLLEGSSGDQKDGVKALQHNQIAQRFGTMATCTRKHL